ncbi:hypothetical protein J6590_068805 [Homalodisca vitripennis]|nr:hypothetical protein J6590_068805 [Homalodisca vitripennis]
MKGIQNQEFHSLAIESPFRLWARRGNRPLLQQSEEGKKTIMDEKLVKREREMYSDMRLLKDLRENHENDYRNYLRMDDETCSYVLEKVRPRIERQDTNLRKAITTEQRLVCHA